MPKRAGASVFGETSLNHRLCAGRATDGDSGGGLLGVPRIDAGLTGRVYVSSVTQPPQFAVDRIWFPITIGMENDDAGTE
jgi:hypothetical protein